MAYDLELAERVRQALSDACEVREVKMFGGLAFMVADRMVACISGGGGALLVRVAPERDVELLARPGARRGMMGPARSMGAGWIAVDASVIADDAGLVEWLSPAMDYHASR